MNSKKLILFTSTAACLLATPLAMAGSRGHSSGSYARGSFSSPQRGFSGARPGFSRSQSGFAAARSGMVRQGQPHFSNRSGITNNRWNRTAANRWQNGNNNWHHGRHHHHHHGRSVYFVDFGWPYYGYGWDYPYYYDYYPYDYAYDYDGGVYQGRDVSLVLQVQQRLANAGYYHGAIDGVIGNGTRSAIRAYERSHRLPIDGRIDNDLLARMGLS